MNKILIFATALLLLASCKSKDNALVGGYDNATKPTKEEIELFRDVVSALDDVDLTPVKVQRQVVAGMNYRFECIDKEKKKVEVVIYQPLPGNGRARVTSIDDRELY